MQQALIDLYKWIEGLDLKSSPDIRAVFYFGHGNMEQGYVTQIFIPEMQLKIYIFF